LKTIKEIVDELINLPRNDINEPYGCDIEEVLKNKNLNWIIQELVKRI
jgi:hypothetical protein